MVRLPLLPLPKTREGWYLLLIVALCILLARSGNRIVELEARPGIVDKSVDNRSADVRRGPVKVTRRTTVAPDGTKTVESTRETASEERHTESKTETSHQETPPARARTRYAGLGVNPLDYARQWRGRAGMTILGALDGGVAVDFDPARFKLDRPMLELAYRF